MTLPATLTAKQQRALDHVTDHPGASTADVARALGVAGKSANNFLSVLYVKRLVGRQEALWVHGMQWYWFPELAPPPSSPVALGRSKSTEPEAS